VFASAIVVFVAGSLLVRRVGHARRVRRGALPAGHRRGDDVPVGRLVLLRAVPKDQLIAALNYLTIPALLGPVTGPALGVRSRSTFTGAGSS